MTALLGRELFEHEAEQEGRLPVRNLEPLAKQPDSFEWLALVPGVGIRPPRLSATNVSHCITGCASRNINRMVRKKP